MLLPMSLVGKRICPGAAICACLLEISNPVLASQLVINSNCDFVVDVPGIFGATHLKYSALKGTVYTQNNDGKFCGATTMKTPFGPSTSSNCFVVTAGELASGDWGNKVSSSSCTLVDATTIAVAFDAAQAERFAGVGPANLHGQAFLKTVGGDVKTCAGEDVALMPATPYFDEMIENVNNGIDIHLDQRAVSLLRRTICDAQGNFSFSGLPTQKWYVLTKVTWGVPHIEEPGERPGLIASLLLGIHARPATDEQGGELLQTIDLHPGDNQVFLTSRDER